MDKRSKVLFFPVEIEKKAPWVEDPPKSVAHFFNQLEVIEFNE